jgi:hypothetical protein
MQTSLHWEERERIESRERRKDREKEIVNTTVFNKLVIFKELLLIIVVISECSNSYKNEY